MSWIILADERKKPRGSAAVNTNIGNWKPMTDLFIVKCM